MGQDDSDEPEDTGRSSNGQMQITNPAFAGRNSAKLQSR